jgi:hypothetical protein
LHVTRRTERLPSRRLRPTRPSEGASTRK